MSETNVAQARPGLSGLDRETRINIAVAETQGATWAWEGVNDPEPFVVLRYRGEVPWACDGDGLNIRGVVTYFGPRYTRDPTAWGALLEKEFNGWETARFDAEFRHRVRWPTHHAHAFKEGPWAASLPAAVCEGVLAKYGVEVPS